VYIVILGRRAVCWPARGTGDIADAPDRRDHRGFNRGLRGWADWFKRGFSIGQRRSQLLGRGIGPLDAARAQPASDRRRVVAGAPRRRAESGTCCGICRQDCQVADLGSATGSHVPGVRRSAGATVTGLSFEATTVSQSVATTNARRRVRSQDGAATVAAASGFRQRGLNGPRTPVRVAPRFGCADDGGAGW